MTWTTPLLNDPPVKKDDVKVSSAEISAYLKKYKLKATAQNKTLAVTAIKIAKKRKNATVGREVAQAGQEKPLNIVYGQTRVPGAFTFLHTDNNNIYLYAVLTLACHELNYVDALFIDDNRIEFDANGISTGPIVDDADYRGLVVLKTDRLGTENQTVEPFLNAWLPGYWTAAHKQLGCALAVVRLTFDGVTFGNGFPQIDFQVQGKKLYDPRTGLTSYSTNAALAVADLLTNTVYGFGFPWDQIDADSLSEAADICEELVPLKGGGTEYRYVVNGNWDTTTDRESIRSQLCDAMAGDVAWTEGKWKFLPGVYRSLSGVSLTLDDVRGEIKVDVLKKRDSSFNSVKGQFVDAGNKFQAKDYPPVTVDAYVAEDGEKVWEEINFPFVSSWTQAQRLARIELEKVRRSVTVTALFGLKALPLDPGDNITFTAARYGFASKVFEVQRRSFKVTETGELLVELVLKENDANVWVWNPTTDEGTMGQPPSTNLPRPGQVGALGGLTLASGTNELLVRGDGTILTRVRVTWAPAGSAFVTSGGGIEIESKPASSEDWIAEKRMPGNSTVAYLEQAQDKTLLDVRIRAVTALGVVGPWTVAVAHYVLGKSQPPADVSGFVAQTSAFGVNLAWNPVADVDLSHYELREGASWGAGSFIATLNGSGLVLEGASTGVHTYWLKAVDTTGNYSNAAASSSVVITAPTLASVICSFVAGSVVFELGEDLGTFAVSSYQLSYGATAETAVPWSISPAKKLSVPVDWEGGRLFWVVATDVAGNSGEPVSVSVSPAEPGVVTGITASVIDNNVLLRWTSSLVGSLPVVGYNVYRGSTFGLASLVGLVRGTFSTVFETVGGDFTYWVEPEDVAGNVGVAAAVTASVLEPPDYVLLLDQALTGGTAINIIDEAGTLIGPVSLTQTIAEHFTMNGWTSPADQISAGWDHWIAPPVSYGHWEKVIDYGSVLTGTIIRVTSNQVDLEGDPAVVQTIAYSVDGLAWISESGVGSVFGSSFRYVKITLQQGIAPGDTEASRRSVCGVLPPADLSIDASDRRVVCGLFADTFPGSVGSGAGLFQISNLSLKLDRKIFRDGGMDTSAALGATTVTFNKTFADIREVQVTPIGTTAKQAIWDFADVPNPTGFDVYVFDSTGTQIASDFSWSVSGV